MIFLKLLTWYRIELWLAIIFLLLTLSACVPRVVDPCLTQQDSSIVLMPGLQPSVSPNGRLIAYLGERIAVSDTNGKNQRKFINTTYADLLPRWSPDGRSIGFVRRQNDAEGYIFKVSLSDSLVTSLNTVFPVAINLLNEQYVTVPIWDWSPIGDKIAFLSTDSANTFLKVISANGLSTLLFNIRLNSMTYPNTAGFSWAHDGNRIACILNNYDHTQDLAIAYIQGDSIKRIYHSSSLNTLYSPAWIPGSDKIVFTDDHLMMIDLQSGNIVQFSTYGSSTKISPDGNKALFEQVGYNFCPTSSTFSQLWSIDLYSNAIQSVTTTGDVGTNNYFFVWDPNSINVYFERSQEICRVKIQ